LGFPLSVKKMPRNVFLELIDKVANKLPGWKAPLINQAGRLTLVRSFFSRTLVRSVLTAIPIYHLIVIPCPKWVVKAIDKIRRGFLWKGRKDVRGGHCVVGWNKVCKPLSLGGLGIHNLEILGWALNLRWLWLKKTQPDRPWAEFDVQVHPNVIAMFSASLCSIVGDGAGTLFWTDRWLHGQCISEIAPSLLNRVSIRMRKRKTVQQALRDNSWVGDISGSLPTEVIVEFLIIWDLTQNIQLQPGVPDAFRWLPGASGEYYVKTAYQRFLAGSVEFEPGERIWKSWAPPKCKFFIWLASLNRCWTADRLARRGLDHPGKCVLCDQQRETIQHILISCVFSRNIWWQILCKVGLQLVAPGLEISMFQDWWSMAEGLVPVLHKDGFNTLVIFVAWWIWKHRNACVFYGVSPNTSTVLQQIHEDARL
jgi:hypothetical protein